MRYSVVVTPGEMGGRSVVKINNSTYKPATIVMAVSLACWCLQLAGCNNADETENANAGASEAKSDSQETSPPSDNGASLSTVSKPDKDSATPVAETPGNSTGPAPTDNTDSANRNESPPRTAETPNVDHDSEAAALARLEKQLAEFNVPPDWLAGVKPAWSTGKPWKEGRQEIRRLLGKNNETSRREAIKLTWEYLQKNDIGDGHEYGMYMFLGGEPLWAILVFRERIKQTELKYPPYFGMKALASLYADHSVYTPAEAALKRGMTMSPPDARWNEMRQAELHDALGDLYVDWGKLDQAKASYREAIRLYPSGKPPYGRHLLPRRVKKVQSKLDLLSIASLEGTTLKDGTYRDRALGYSGDINLTIRIQGGRIADIKVQHQEKIDQNACVLVPQRIIDSQGLQVDGISGATVTKDAIIGGTLRGLKQAGLK